MKKLIFGIFAHPDDEAFGPSGALLKETKDGNDLYLITFTNGAAGMNPDNVPDLGKTRTDEWRTCGRLFGAKSMHPLGYEDGHLNNEVMIEAAEKITNIVTAVLEDAQDDIAVEFMSMDLNGVTGHIDHIVASRTTCLVFYRMKALDSRVTKLWLACYPVSAFPKHNTDWIYMEAGRSPSEIDEVVDGRMYREELINIVKTHHSQRNDGENYLKWQGDNLGLCSFIVKT